MINTNQYNNTVPYSPQNTLHYNPYRPSLYSYNGKSYSLNDGPEDTNHIKTLVASYIKNNYPFLTEPQINEVLSWVSNTRLQYLYENGTMFEIEKNIPNKYKIIKEEQQIEECRQRIKEHEEKINRLKGLI